MLALKLIAISCVLLMSHVDACCKKHETEDDYDYPIKAVAIMKGELTNPDTGVTQPIEGSITFEQASLIDPLKIKVNITGLLTGKTMKHGLHVHQSGFTSTSNSVATLCGSTGPHFNPTNVSHGDITAKIRHAGDYGNIISNENGIILQEFTDKVSRLSGAHSIIGRGIVLHAQADDLGLGNNEASKLNGNSGARIACGMIGAL